MPAADTPTATVHPSWCARGEFCTAHYSVGGVHRSQPQPISREPISGHLVGFSLASWAYRPVDDVPHVEIHARRVSRRNHRRPDWWLCGWQQVRLYTIDAAELPHVGGLVDLLRILGPATCRTDVRRPA